jgi:hypothetical protein
MKECKTRKHIKIKKNSKHTNTPHTSSLTHMISYWLCPHNPGGPAIHREAARKITLAINQHREDIVHLFGCEPESFQWVLMYVSIHPPDILSCLTLPCEGGGCIRLAPTARNIGPFAGFMHRMRFAPCIYIETVDGLVVGTMGAVGSRKAVSWIAVAVVFCRGVEGEISTAIFNLEGRG